MGTLNILIGDITCDSLLKEHDIIVNPTNPRMVCGAGVSQNIFHKAGVNQLEEYTQKKYNISYYTNDNLMQVGEVRITPGFNLGIDIMFAQGPKSYDYETLEEAISVLLKTYINIIETAYSNGYKRVLCPSIGTGSYCFEHKNIGKQVVSIIKSSIEDKKITFDLVLYNEEDKKYYL